MTKTSLNSEIMDMLEGRLEKGRNTYNQDVTLEDPRDWVQEALEEALDLAIYVSAQLLRIKNNSNEGLTDLDT